jgi:hypothetical protein
MVSCHPRSRRGQVSWPVAKLSFGWIGEGPGTVSVVECKRREESRRGTQKCVRHKLKVALMGAIPGQFRVGHGFDSLHCSFRIISRKRCADARHWI